MAAFDSGRVLAQVICELIERSKMLKKLSLQNTGLDDRRLKVRCCARCM